MGVTVEVAAIHFPPTLAPQADHPSQPGPSRRERVEAGEGAQTMLNLLGSRGPAQCDGASRRDFLKVGALGASGLLLPDLLRARAESRARGQATRNTSVVWMWLGGGPTQIE